MVIAGIDVQPLILAVAGLIVALTPVAVAYLSVQVSLLKIRQDEQGKQLKAGQQSLEAGIADVRAAVSAKALETQAVVKDVGGK